MKIKTDECYIILVSEISGIKLFSEKIFGYKDIMNAGRKRDSHNLIAKYTQGVPYLNIHERYGFENFQDLQNMYNKESKI